MEHANEELLTRRLKRLAVADGEVLKAFEKWAREFPSDEGVEILRWCADYRRTELAEKGTL